LSAETVAARFHHFDFFRKASLCQLSDKGLSDLDASGGMAARASADQQVRSKNLHGKLSSFVSEEWAVG
jgi:hypothetical protein